jgi:iron complex outermembrane receptor protein
MQKARGYGRMKTCVRAMLVSTVLAAMPAWAQVSPGATGPAAPAATNAEAIARTVGDGEIIVTANKREQNLQDVSIAVTAVGAERLTTARVDNIQDLQVLVPNISFGNDFAIAKIFIRGIGTNISTTGSEPAVAVYTDGAVNARPEAQFASMFDIDRVEVLRGPQGTLFGRNAVGGAINFITAKPTRDFSGFANFSYGNYQAVFGEGAVSGPLAPGIYARAAVRIDTHDGYGRNEFTGNGIDDLNKKMGRVQLLFDRDAPLTVLLAAEIYHEKEHANAVKYGGPTFALPELFPVGRGGFATGSARNIASEVDPQNDLDTHSFTATIDYKLGDGLSVRSLSNYRKMDAKIIQDVDISSVVSSLAVNGFASSIQNRQPYSKQVSEELQLLVDVGRLQGVVGGFYYNESFGALPNNIGVGPDGRGEAGYIPALTAAGIAITDPINARYSATAGDLNVEAWAAFADFSYKLSDQFVLKAGARYSDESRRMINAGYIIGRAGRGPVIQFNNMDRKKFNNFAPKLGAEYHPTDDVMLYYVYQQGFKSGTGELSLTNNPIIGPEKVYNHEAGIKSQFLDRRLTLNVAGFYNKLTGLQLDRTTYDPVLSLLTTFENAASTHAYGVEVDASMRITPEFRVDVSGSYLHSTFDTYLANDPTDARNIAGSSVFAPTAVNLDGNVTRYSPKWVWNVHPAYNLELGGGGRLLFQGDVSYKSKQFHTEFNDDRLSAPKYTIVNGSIRYSTPDDRISVQGFVNNAFDKLQRGGTFALATARVLGVTYLPPRTYGIIVGFKF